MIVINYNTAFKALDDYIKAYNSRTEDLSLQVRQSVAATAKELIRIYGISLVKANGIEKVDKGNLPSLKTNNVQLSKLGNSSTRTVQRHIKKLIQAGIITRKVWHGTNSSYEVWINPNILLAKEKESHKAAKRHLNEVIEKTSLMAQNRHFKQEQTTKCLHTESCDTGNKNNIVIGVHNSEKQSRKQGISDTESLAGNSSGDITGDNSKRCEHPLTGYTDSSCDTGNTLSGHTGEKVAKKTKDAGEKVRNFRADDQKWEMKAPESPARTASLNLYVRMLWLLAKNVLYKDVFLTDRQEMMATKLLRQWYEPVSDNSLSRVHEIYVERISLARKFVQKDPANRFVQLPNRYFNPTNPSGFTGTKKWWNVQEKRKKEVQAKLILSAQIRRYLNNEKKDTSLRKPSLQLYRDCEQRIGKLGDPVLLEQFHSAILSSNSNTHLYPN
ncbi:hypothetical protein QQ008_07295 [Fulvivirgaceae bacterium BMA10]|uniref:Uncharacterized protein n=1 Tax=Splendidivirga corallicola TaxID=3051826 RepID=A0ABT8KKC6_9BACT|nr:hypothetical protein [Fulvivirgaceae bacterium BMA10]